MSAATELDGIENVCYEAGGGGDDALPMTTLPRPSISLPNNPRRSVGCGGGGVVVGAPKSVSIDIGQVAICPPSLLPFGRAAAAVSVQNAYKSYPPSASPPILNNLNMTVKQGTIYSLLGASGCGKTTLLSCIVGLQKLNSGEIYVLGAKPGSKESGVPGKRVGYMPQEIALFGEFSIEESLYFYGRMYSMTSVEIQENITFLMDFLNLPPRHRSVKNLSGGQQRRVSFACSMIHNPELLLLDEPTVGVDALLRKSIWEHLLKLVSTGKTTVIITTHYIEEARLSNTIGLMRNGKLLVEDSPNHLLRKYKTHLLEDIVMKLCLLDSNSQSSNNHAHTHAHTPKAIKGGLNGKSGESYTKIGEDKAGLEEESEGDPEGDEEEGDGNEEEVTKWRKLHRASVVAEMRKKPERLEELEDSWNRLVTLTFKNVLTSVRNLIFLAFILFCPAMHVIVVCVAIGGDPKGLSFAVVNHELGVNGSCEGQGQVFWGCPLQLERDQNHTSTHTSTRGLLSCHFLNLLDKNYIHVKMYPSKGEALEDVKDSRAWGVLTFPANYTASVLERGILGPSADLNAVYGSQIKIKMDFSNKQIGTEIGKDLYMTLHKMMRNISLECGIDPLTLEVPLSYEDAIYGNNDMSFREYIAPSVLLGILFFFPVSSSGLNYISEKRLGTLDRSLVAGVTHGEFMLAYSGVQLVILFIQTSLAFAFLVFIFGIEIAGPFSLAYSMALLVGFAGISVGYILSSICSQEIQAVLLAMGMFVPNLLLAGMIWPLEGMNVWLQYVAYILPCTLACETMRSIVSRGVGFSHPKVWPGFASTLLWIIFYWTLLAIINKIKARK